MKIKDLGTSRTAYDSFGKSFVTLTYEVTLEDGTVFYSVIDKDIIDLNGTDEESINKFRQIELQEHLHNFLNNKNMVK